MATYFLVEGPDGAGKTTRINSMLAAMPGAFYVHFSNPKTYEEELNYWKVYLAAIKDNADKQVVIFDRCWYSDMVYNTIIRNHAPMPRDTMELLELAVKGCGGGIIIYCTGQVRTLWSRCQRRGETYIKSQEMLKQLHDRYEAVMKMPKYLPVIRYDTTVRW